MTEKQILWEKFCSLTTDGAAVITGHFLGVGARVKAVATNCILKHCNIHREALAVKPLSSDKQRKTELESVLDIVVKTVNYIKCNDKGKSAKVFKNCVKKWILRNCSTTYRGALAPSWQSFDSCVQIKTGNISFSCREKS